MRGADPLTVLRRHQNRPSSDSQRPIRLLSIDERAGIRGGR
jgi:hypothetical protein